MVHEIIVWGVPLSVQASSKHMAAWKLRVHEAAYAAIRQVHRHEFANVAVTIIQFAFDWSRGDLDNIAKPILDALCGPAYFAHQYVTQLTLRRTELGAENVEILDPTPTLANALQQARDERQDFVHIRIEDKTDHRRLPWIR